jgi:hypothetical protein
MALVVGACCLLALLATVIAGAFALRTPAVRLVGPAD